MNRALMLIPMAVVMAAAAPIDAAPPDSAVPETDIIVEAERLTTEKAREKARDYVRPVMPFNPEWGQYARFGKPICIRVHGIPDQAIVSQITTRIAVIADEIGLQQARPGCRPNVIIAFTDDGAGLVARVRARKPRAMPPFDSMLHARLAQPELPVRWWHPLVSSGVAGGAGPIDTSMLASASSNGTPLGNLLPAGPGVIATNNWNANLIDTNLMVWANAAVAVVDVNHAQGVPLDALTDYLAMVTLAPMRMPPFQTSVPTVLGLFEPGKRPTRLTDWDLAFLKGLYSVQMNRGALRQRQQLVSAMARAMTSPDDEQATP